MGSQDRNSSSTVLINKSFLESNPVPGIYRDSKLTGFRLKVTGAGSKVFLVDSKVKGFSRPVKVTIGNYGEPFKSEGPLTADKARKEAERIRGAMLQGINPNIEHRRTVEKELAFQAESKGKDDERRLTLRFVFNDYTSKTKLSESTKYTYRCDMFKTLSDWLDKPLNDIDENDVTDRHRKITEAGHAGQANSVMRVLRALYNFALRQYKGPDKQPLIKGNPVLALRGQWNQLKPRTGIIRDHEMKAFLGAVAELNHPIASDYFRLVLLTGLRADEAASLQWNTVDFRAGSFTVLATKNGRDHVLPMTDCIREFFKARWQARGKEKSKSEYVFPGENARGYMSDFRYQQERIIETCKRTLSETFADDGINDSADFYFTLHDLRRTFTTAAARLLPEYSVKRLTNHIDKADVTQAHYVNLAVDQLKGPLTLVQSHILSLAESDSVSGDQTADAKRVIPMNPSARIRAGK